MVSYFQAPSPRRAPFFPTSPAIASITAAMRWALAIIGVGIGLPTLASAASYLWDNVPIHGGGFVSGLEFHPTEPGLLYARTDVGGAYRHDPATGRWIALNDSIGGLDNAFMELGVASVALDPQDPDRVYLACGQYVAWWAPDATVLRSTDRGATWERTTLPFNLDGNSDGRNTGENLVVDPNLGSVLLLGTPDAGLWRSTNHGATFTQLTTFPIGNITWVLFDRRSGAAGSPTQTIYAGLAVTTPGSPSVFRSTDAGATWSALPGQPTVLAVGGGDPPPPTQPIPQQAALAYDATGRLFITYGNALGPNGVSTGAVWRYDTTSGVWANITPTPAPPSQQGGFGGVSVSAQNPAVIAVSTLDRWWPGDEIYRSTDGGATWSSRLRSGTLDRSSAPWSSSLNPHWIGDVEIDPANANRALFVTGNGLFQTTNFTATAPTWAFYNAGLEETVPLGLISPSSGPELVSVIGDFDGFRHDDITGPPPSARHSPRHGTNRSLAAAALAPAIMARTFGGSAGAPRGAYSTDTAATWTDFAASPSTTADPGQIAVNADGTRFVWNQPGLVPHLSLNNGASWSPATGSVPAGSHVPVADPVAPLRFYVYDSGTGILHRSTDGGASFSSAASGLPTGANPPVAAPGREGDLWLPAWNQGLRRSTDAGATFTTVSSVQRAYRLGFGRAAEGATYPAIYLWGRIDGIDALWRSIDTALTWERINDDAHNFGHIGVLTGDPRRFGRVYIGTGGRGIIYGDPDDAPPPVLTLPAGWSSRDIGGPALAGSASETNGTFTLRGSGGDIWGGWDQFHFASRLASGDATLVARVTSVANTDTWAKAGVMFRASLAPNAPFVALFQRPDRLVTLQWRTATGANAEMTAGSGLFGNTADLKWLRLQRSGDTFTAAYSSDGATWTTIATMPTVVLPLDAELGLALTSHNGSSLGTATFAGVVFTPEPLALTTTATLPGASADLAYTSTLAARGGFPAYDWTLNSGTLPPGLTLDSATGQISGTPEATGTFVFIAGVTDNAGTFTNRSFTLTVQGLPYADWLAQHFTPNEQTDPALGGSISADPDADTLANLAEWALGLDPRVPDAAGALGFAVAPGGEPGASDFVVTFTRRRAAPGVACAIETTSDLAAPTWTSLPEGDPTWTVINDDGGLTQTVTVRIPMTTARVFARLRFTQN